MSNEHKETYKSAEKHLRHKKFSNFFFFFEVEIGIYDIQIATLFKGIIVKDRK